MDFYEKIGMELMLLRKSQKITQSEMSKKLNKTTACISKYESGKIAIDLNTFCQYCTALQLDPKVILNRCLITEVEPVQNHLHYFFSKEHYFLYHYDAGRNILHKSLIEIHPNKEEVYLYLFIDDYKNYKKEAAYLYYGKIETHSLYTRVIFRNVKDSLDLIMLMIFNEGYDSTYRIAQMDILSYYYQPITTKCIISQDEIKGKDKLIALTKINSEEIKHLKNTNYFMVLNDNIKKK